jgi:predicted MFS family arabinose efflux permease
VPFTQGLPMIVIFSLTGVSIAIYSGLLPVFASDIADDVGNGALMGLLTVTFCIANAIIALIGSLVLKSSPQMTLFMGSALVFVASLLLVRFIYVKLEYLITKVSV